MACQGGCKICGTPINKRNKFVSHNMKYFLCDECGHINGEYEEDVDFAQNVYNNSEHGVTFYDSTTLDAYMSRVDKVYLPKAEFLLSILEDEGQNLDNLKYLDVGAGAGYFVNALLKKGLDIYGIEIDKNEVDIANRLTPAANMILKSQEGIVEEIAKSNSQIVSFIGVLEHIINLHEVLDAVKDNENISYIYFSLPIFSYSVIWEAVFPNIFNRICGGWHTHIFSDESIDYMLNIIGFERCGEWRFGMDAADLLRSVDVTLQRNGNEYLAHFLRRNMLRY